MAARDGQSRQTVETTRSNNTHAILHIWFSWWLSMDSWDGCIYQCEIPQHISIKLGAHMYSTYYLVCKWRGTSVAAAACGERARLGSRRRKAARAACRTSFCSRRPATRRPQRMKPAHATTTRAKAGFCRAKLTPTCCWCACDTTTSISAIECAVSACVRAQLIGECARNRKLETGTRHADVFTFTGRAHLDEMIHMQSKGSTNGGTTLLSVIEWRVMEKQDSKHR